MAISRRELLGATYVSLSAAFVLAGYSAIRNASSTLFKESYGAAKLPLLMAVMPLGVLAILCLYGRLLSALGPRRTLWVTTLGSGALIAALYGAIRLEVFHPQVRLARAALRIFSEAYIALLIEQYWSFLTSTLATPSAKKLNGPIMGVASLGAVAGAWIVAASVQRFGTANMLLLAAATVVPAAILSDLAYRFAGEPRETPPDADRLTRDDQSTTLALNLFIRSPLLIAILGMVLATQVLATVLDLNFQTVLQNAIPDRDPQTRWAAQFEAIMNLLAAFMQFVAAPLLLRFLPIAAILIAMPLIQMTAAGISLTHPSLRSAAAAYVIFKMFDYSLFKAAKETLYIPLSYNARYRAKEVIDVLGYRAAKGATATALAIYEAFGGVVARVYGPVAIGAAAAWGVAAVLVSRWRRRALAAAESFAVASDSPDALR
jgi:AAA family ATP:ADP antiporter